MAAIPEKSKTVVFGVSASIAAYRACDIILELRRRSVNVIPVLSRDAHHFVTALALQSVALNEAYQDFFSTPGRAMPVHIELAKKADLVVICPASADIIARMSLGLCDDLLTSVVLAAQSPVLFCPAMNDKMYNNPATQEHIDRLKKRGYTMVPPVVGDLVCTDNAIGHLADWNHIVTRITQTLGL